MKITIAGDTPIARLTNLMRGVLAVSKTDIERQEKEWKRVKHRRKKRRT